MEQLFSKVKYNVKAEWESEMETLGKSLCQ